MTGAPVLAIDGPSGSGKGTVSRRIAQKLGWQLLDSGALYRLVALAGRLERLDADDEAAHAALAGRLQVRFGQTADGEEQIWLGESGQDVTAAIRTEEAGQGASRVAVWPGVRSALFQRQRDFARPPGLVADGRDMGTVVFPGANLKVFLTASPEVRAERRYKQLIEKGIDANLRALSRDLEERDARDANRALAPLVPASDSQVLDSSVLSVDAVVERIIAWCKERKLGRA